MSVLLLYSIFTGFGLAVIKIFHVEINKNNWQKIIGESFFITVFVIVGLINLLQLFGYGFNTKFGFALVTISALIMYIYYLYLYLIRGKYLFSKVLKTNSNIWIYLLVSILVVIHLYLISNQNQLLPLTPWDAWYGWIAKAKIWFYHNINQDLVNRANWLLSQDKFTNPTVHYPDALPLLYVFNSGYFGWDETALNAIYPSMFLAFLLAFYGNIKLLINSQYALAGIVIITTIPFINFHVTLAGYADIWVAAFLTLSLFNIQQLLTKSNLKNVVYLSVFLITLPMFKLEAWIWLGILLLTALICLVSQEKRKWFYSTLIIIILLWYFSGGFLLQLPIGNLTIKPNLIEIPFMGSYMLVFVNTTAAWLEALFLGGNWNLLWYSLPFLLYWSTKVLNKNAIALPTIFLTISSLFIYVLFYMTYASLFADDFTSSNRVILHIVPIYIYALLQVFYQYQNQENSLK